MNIHPSGKFAYVKRGSLSSETISILAINEDSGMLTPATPATELQVPAAVMDIAIDSAGSFLYVTSSDNNVRSYRINSETGELLFDSEVASGPGAQEVIVAPSAAALYVLNRGNGTVSVHALDAGSPGAATFITAGDFGVSMKIDPGGQFVYVIAFLDADASNIFLAFRIDAEGRLNAEATTTLHGAAFDFAASPSGQFVYIAYASEEFLFGYTVHPLTGALNRLEPPFPAPAVPRDIRIVDVPA